jgi:putative tryptophan/tyrosine transport system substrate-binding protein
MRRRQFILLFCGAAIRWPRVARAQKPSKVYRLGYLAEVRIPPLIEALQTGLRDLGYVEGRNLKVEYRFGGNLETLEMLAAELVALGPDVIVTVATLPALTAKRATVMIPIVMATVGDPLRVGIVANLAHSGGNITGMTMYESELSGKRAEVLKEALPSIPRLAVLGNATNPFNQSSWEDTQSAARGLGIVPLLFTVRQQDELPTAFARTVRVVWISPL